MTKKTISIILAIIMVLALAAGCSQTPSSTTAAPTTTTAPTGTETTAGPTTQDFTGETLSILVSAGWMDNRYDEVISNFEDTYGCTVDLQTIPADQYGDLLQNKLTTGTAADIFWIQSNPFAISSVIVDYENYCIDFSGEDWESVVPEARLTSCKVDGKLYGLQLWHNSPEFVLVYNKTLFTELGINKIPTSYAELKATCATIAAKGITPWFVPGADAWQHQLSFFQIGGVYEAATPGLYDKLNDNTATFAGNAKMLEVLTQFKELSDLGYFGEDWIGTGSTNMANEFGDRTIAMAMANSSFIQQIKDDTDSADEFGLFLIPLGDNTWYPTNPAGPTMFGYKGTTHEDLVRAFFSFVTTTESLQSILDNSPAYTNLHVNDSKVIQHWLPAEDEFIKSIPAEKMVYSVLQTGTKYTNDYWMNFGADMVAFCQGTLSADQVLANMDANRAASAKLAKDPAWD